MLLICLCSCKARSKDRIYIFYSDTCHSCQLLENELIPEIEVMQNIEMIRCNIDEAASIEQYQTFIEALDHADETMKEQCMTPFIVYDQKFAVVGYTSEMKNIYIELIQTAQRNEDLSQKLFSGVWLFKEGK